MKLQDTPFSLCFCMVVPSISTSHIRKEDGEKLLKAEYPVMAIIGDGEGHILSITSLTESLAGVYAGYSEEMVSIVTRLQEEGFNYVRFDCDGDELDTLPKFTW